MKRATASIVVREYARLTTDSVENTLDQASISNTAFDWLCMLAANFNKGGASLLQVENRRWLRLDNYVGIIETPCGTFLEILPKHNNVPGEDGAIASRRLLIKLLSAALDLPQRTTAQADIQTFHHPLLEWVMKQFVISLDTLIKRGVRFDYQRVEEEQRYLRGQLNVGKQLRQPPGRAHIFNISHDLFLADRPENRLLKSALMRVCRATEQPDTWRLSHELVGLLAEIPESKDLKNDFQQWCDDRLMAHYQPARPWCELVLGQHMPLALRGNTKGISMLFPMEQLFERYVEVQLRKQLRHPFVLKSQAASEFLCGHDGGRMFRLKPDLLIQENKKNVIVLDTKWKLVSTSDKANKYGLSQSDFYQLFAYGHKYLGGQGEMLLIYPLTEHFSSVLPIFEFSPGLKLWVAPFDFAKDEILWPATMRERFFDQSQPTG